jgi:hypothetical protein
MPSFWDRVNPIGKNSYVMPIANKSFRQGAKDLLMGTPEKHENVSTLRPEQEALYQQAVNAGLQPGAGGAFGTSADYYRGLMSNESPDYQAFAAPALRQYSQDIVPGISEQFAGMGSGGLSSSGFQNAQIQGATDLSERLGALRAQLRQSGAQGLQNIGQIGLGNYSQDRITQPGSEGLLSQAAPLVGAGLGFMAGGPGGAMAGYQAGNWFRGGGNQMGTSSPYGGGGGQSPAASPQINNPYAQQGGFQLPKFGQTGGGRGF